MEAGPALKPSDPSGPAAALRRLPWGDVVTGVALLGILALSFVGAWISGSGPLRPATYAWLWEGFGILPGTLAALALGWFALTRLAGLRVVTPVPDAAIWAGFAVAEVTFFVLHWVADSGVSGPGGGTAPGWAAYCAIGAALLAAAGALLRARSPAAVAAPGRPGRTLDIPALLRPLPVGDGLILTALILLVGFSFIPAWIRAAVLCPPGGGAALGCVPLATSYAPLWGGSGIVPGMLLLIAVLWFSVSRIADLRMAVALETPLWIGFGVGETVLFLLHWRIDSGYTRGAVVTSPGSTGTATTPGWAAFCAVAFCGLLGLGAWLNLRGGRAGARSGPEEAEPGAG